MTNDQLRDILEQARTTPITADPPPDTTPTMTASFRAAEIAAKGIPA